MDASVTAQSFQKPHRRHKLCTDPHCRASTKEPRHPEAGALNRCKHVSSRKAAGHALCVCLGALHALCTAPSTAQTWQRSTVMQVAAANEKQSLVVLRPKAEAIKAAQAGEIRLGSTSKHRS